jgi:hypothetical protein
MRTSRLALLATTIYVSSLWAASPWWSDKPFMTWTACDVALILSGSPWISEDMLYTPKGPSGHVLS